MNPAIKYLSLTVLVLVGMPRMGVKIGPLPFYVLDLLIGLTYYHARSIASVNSLEVPFAGKVKAIIFFAIFSEVFLMITYGEALLPAYILIRTLLAFSLFYSAGIIVRSFEDVELIFKAGLIGLIITSILMMMTSISATRQLAMNYVFSLPFLEPAAEQTVRMYSDSVDVMRGRSLVGVSILSGAFINTFWPLISLLYRWPRDLGKWKTIALIGSLIAPVAVVMSYSRGAILGLFMVVGSVLFFGSENNKRAIIISMVIGLSAFSYIGWDSEYFFFDRLENRTTAMLENPYEDERETERIYAYSEPFEHVIEHPLFFIIGEGVAIGKLGVGAEQVGAADHAVFAKAYYSYGMVAAFIYVFLVVSGFKYLLFQMRLHSRFGGIPLVYSQALFAGLAGMLPWFVFGHAAVSTPRGAMLFFLFFGLIASLRNFDPYHRSATNSFS